MGKKGEIKFLGKFMNDEDIVKIFLDTQEWQTFECKRAAIKPSDLLETVVGMANAEGGLFSRGIDNKTAKGVSPY